MPTQGQKGIILGTELIEGPRSILEGEVHPKKTLQVRTLL